MFTGIVECETTVALFEQVGGVAKLVLNRPKVELNNASIGQSFSIDGVCLSLTDYTDTQMSFDLIRSTLEKSTLGQLQAGVLVNFEQSAQIGDRNGGHELSGHVDCSARVCDILRSGTSAEYIFEPPCEMMRYIFPQGFVAVNGVSLTISSIDKRDGKFSVWIIPETSRITNIGNLSVDGAVNIEFERKTQVIVDTIHSAVEQYMTAENMGRIISQLDVGRQK
ncbi:riboflavin synthase subunit alpha [Maritalea sp.]|uniref:riboflavin synthase subunit alpha n=1 Tax=Maritalea sp. TaxID=2003361 RepID=UPI003EF4CB7A